MHTYVIMYDYTTSHPTDMLTLEQMHTTMHSACTHTHAHTHTTHTHLPAFLWASAKTVKQARQSLCHSPLCTCGICFCVYLWQGEFVSLKSLK